MYLVSRAPYPFTADDIRPALGLYGRQMDLIIEAGIASLCALSQKPVREEVWAIADGSTPGSLGIASKVGPAYQLPADHADRRWFRDHTFTPRPEAIEAVRERIIRWCNNQHDIALAILAERSAAASFRTGETPIKAVA